MTRFFSYSFATLGLLALIVTVGCGPSGLGVQPVTGTVTYNGEPLEGAVVTFISTDPLGHGATGTTAANGTYSLTTHAAASSGAVIGDYDVVILKTILVDRLGNEFLDDNQPLGPSGRPEMRHLIPVKYSGDGTPPILSATVQRGRNVINFDLED